MKFVTSFLTVLAAVSSVSSLNLVKRDDLPPNITAACKKDVETSQAYIKCFGDDAHITEKSYVTVCPVLNGDLCKKFFSNPFAYVPNCRNDNSMNIYFQKSFVNYNKGIISVFCNLDGGKLCPAGLSMIAGKGINESLITETCKKPNCVKGLTEYLNANINEMDSLAALGIMPADANAKALYNRMKASLSKCSGSTGTSNTKPAANAKTTTKAVVTKTTALASATKIAQSTIAANNTVAGTVAAPLAGTAVPLTPTDTLTTATNNPPIVDTLASGSDAKMMSTSFMGLVLVLALLYI